MAIPTVTTSDVDSLLSEIKTPLLVYLFGASVIPQKDANIELLAKTHANIEWLAKNCGESARIVKVDVDKDPELSDRFGIPWSGAVLFFLSGEFKLSLEASTPVPVLLRTLMEIK